MLVVLDDRTWTRGEDTAQLVEHIHGAMRAGVHLQCCDDAFWRGRLASSLMVSQRSSRPEFDDAACARRGSNHRLAWQ